MADALLRIRQQLTFLMAEAGNFMVIDEAGSLHKGITGRFPHKTEPKFLQSLAETGRFSREGRYIPMALPVVDDRLTSHAIPDDRVKCFALIPQGKNTTGIVDRGLDFSTVPDNTGII